ncbi:MAG: hypothetical protein PHN72_01055 [Bacilli bacterium]|nr:hypothetical protein [Bacilli bacterium]
MKKLYFILICFLVLFPSMAQGKTVPNTIYNSVGILDNSEIITNIEQKEAQNDSYLVCDENIRIPYQVVSLLRTVEMLIKIGVPIILIVMGMIDFGKVVMGKPDEQMKKTKSAFASRMIAGVLVFFVVSIVEMVLPLINTEDTIVRCTKCVLLNKEECTYINVEYPSATPVPTPVATPKPTVTPVPTKTPVPTTTPDVTATPSPSPEVES